MILLLAYILTIPAANWMIGNVGTACAVGGPCVIPVGFGLHAPSGVLMIGLALVLRDAIQRRYGVVWSLSAVVVGCAISAAMAPASLVLASGVAFALSELADLAVYTPLQRRRLLAAVLLSGAVGAVVDSAAFVLIAFGSLDYVAGQIVGKLWMVMAAAPAVLLMRQPRRATS